MSIIYSVRRRLRREKASQICRRKPPPTTLPQTCCITSGCRAYHSSASMPLREGGTRSLKVSTPRDGEGEERKDDPNLHGHVVVPSALFPDCLSSEAFFDKAAKHVSYMSARIGQVVRQRAAYTFLYVLSAAVFQLKTPPVGAGAGGKVRTLRTVHSRRAVQGLPSTRCMLYPMKALRTIHSIASVAYPLPYNRISRKSETLRRVGWTTTHLVLLIDYEAEPAAAVLRTAHFPLFEVDHAEWLAGRTVLRLKADHGAAESTESLSTV